MSFNAKINARGNVCFDLTTYIKSFISFFNQLILGKYNILEEQNKSSPFLEKYNKIEAIFFLANNLKKINYINCCAI